MSERDCCPQPPTFVNASLTCLAVNTVHKAQAFANGSLEHSGVLGRLGACIVKVISDSHRNSLKRSQVSSMGWGGVCHVRGSGCAAN